MATPPQKRAYGSRRVLRWAWMTAKVVGALVVLVIAGALFALNLPAGRRLVVSKVNDALKTTLMGSLVLERIGHIGLTGVSGVAVRVNDPEGVPVLFVDQATVRLSVLALARSALFGKGDIVVGLDEATLGYVDANISADAKGDLRIARAFEPRPAPPKPASTTPARGTTIELKRFVAQHTWVHGVLPGAPLVDADVDGIAGSVHSSSKALTIDVNQVSVITRAMPRDANAHLAIEAHYAAPSPKGRDKFVEADVRGDVGGIAMTAHALLDGQEFAAKVDVPEAAAEVIRALVPEAPLYQPVSLHGEAEGVLPQVHAKVHFTAGTGTADITAKATLSDAANVVHAELETRHIDARTFAPTAPASEVGANLVADATQNKSGISGTYSLELLPGTAAGNATPRSQFSGTLQMATAGGLTVTSSGVIEEIGAPVSLELTFRQLSDASTLAIDVRSHVARLEDTRVRKAGVRGAVDLSARGTLALGKSPQVDVDLSVNSDQLSQLDNQARKAWLKVHARGPLANPRIDAILQVHGASLGTMRFANTVVTAAGTQRDLDVTVAARPVEGPKILADTHVQIGEVVALRHPSITLTRDDVRAVIAASLVQIGRETRVEELRVDGLGDTLRANARISGATQSFQISSNEIDLPKLSRLSRMFDSKEGHLGLDVDLTLQGGGARGHARVDLTRATIAGHMRDGNAHVEFDITGKQLVGRAHARLGEFGKLDIDTLRADLGEGPLGAAVVKNATGTMGFNGQIDIAQIKSLFPRGALPFDDMQGVVRLNGSIGRASGNAVPDFKVDLETKGLVLSGRGERERVGDIRVVDTPPWHIEGVDFDAQARVSEGGDMSLEARVRDSQGPLMSLSTHAKSVPFAQLMKAGTPPLETLGRVPFSAQMSIPRRNLKSLPAILETRQLEGDIAASAEIGGTLSEPTVDLSASTHHFASSVVRTAAPLDAQLTGQYRAGAGKVRLGIGAKGAETLNAELSARAVVADFLRGAPEPAWDASLHANFADFSLDTLALLSQLQISGRLSGKLAVDDLHRDARMSGDLSFGNFKLGRVLFPRGSAHVAYDGHGADAAVRFEQSDGFIDIKSKVALDWGKSLAPTPREAEPASLDIKAEKLRVAAALPFVEQTFSDLDGRLDANAHIELARGVPPKMAGSLQFKEGTVQLTRVGEQFHDVAAKVAFTSDGNIRLDDVVAYGSTGRVTARGSARLDGLTLVSAKGELHIPSNDPLPVDIDGQSLGDIDGDVNVHVEQKQALGALSIGVDIPRLHVGLPLASSNTVQELGQAEKIHVGYFRRRRQFVLLPHDADDLAPPEKKASASPAGETTIAVHLGDNIEIRKGTTLRILLDGDPVVHLGEKVRLSGQIRLTRGLLEVQGRRFEVEKGTISFVGDDPANPQVLVTAGWSAPDGTRVYADFVGPLKTGKVTLRSEPGRPQNEILALIMFGSADGMSSSSYQAKPRPNASQEQAGAVAGGFATEGLSKGLDDLTGLDIATKIDTTETGNPKPELQLQIARDISLQIGYVVGELPLGTNQDKTLLTVDWRFRRNWSLDATFGDKGSSIMDLIWQYRY